VEQDSLEHKAKTDSVPKAFLQQVKKVDFRSTDMRDIARGIAQQYGLNVFVDPEVEKKITMSLLNIKVIDVFQSIAERHHLELAFSNNILTISSLNTIPPKKWQVHWAEERLTLELTDEPLDETLRHLADSTGFTLVADQSLAGTVTGKINAMPFDEGLSLFLRTNGLRLGRSGEAYLIQRMYNVEKGASTTTGLWIKEENGNFYVEANQVPLLKALQELASIGGSSISILGEPVGKITVQLKELPLEECLQIFLLESGFSWRREGNLYIVAKTDARSMQTSRLFRLNHIKVDGVIERLPNKTVKHSDLKVVPEHNALLVSGAPDVIMDIEKILAEIDKPIPQVFFEALVVDYTISDSYEFSIQAGLENNDTTRSGSDSWIPGVDFLWNGSTANKYLGKIDKALGGINIGKLPDDFYLRVRALETAGKAKIRSRPQISSLNGHSAELKVGETQYYKLISETPVRDPSQVFLQTTERFQTVEINISLKVTPWVSASGEITVEIYPEFNTPGEQFSPELPPNIQSRSLSSTVRLRDGETIVLGGLIQEIDSENVSRVPLIGRIPLLGKLFSNTTRTKAKSELIIYVTPRLLYTDDWLPGGETE